jgi:hypothetical protein
MQYVDAAWHKDTGNGGGVGCVVRDSSSNFIAAKTTMFFDSVASSKIMESFCSQGGFKLD